MDYFLKLDWSGTFTPQLTLPEVLIRGTVVYFALLTLLRVIPKWQAGPGSIASMLFVVLLGGLAADAVKGPAESVTDILLLVLAVMLWVIILDWLSYRFRWIHFLTQDQPSRLVVGGRVIQKTLQREMISEEDLIAQLRRQGVDDIGDVQEACLEADGSISVVKKVNHGETPTSGSTSPVETCDAPGEADPATARVPDEGHHKNGRRPARPDGEATLEGESADSEAMPGEDDPELRDFLAAAQRLQDRLEWHQEQVAKFKEALARNGVRLKPASRAVRKAEPKSQGR